MADACGGMCPGSVMNAVTAAFSTQGYWVQSDLVWQLANTDLGLWAPLLYIMAVFTGLIMMAMGQPPRMYIWFMIGPGIYNWALFTTEPVKGVSWMVASVPQKQEEVWKLAEPGLKNTNAVIREGVTVSANEAPSKEIEVPMLFVWFDELISAQVQWLVGWTGVYSQEGAGGGGGKSNLHTNPGVRDADAWHILSNSKWPMLENITSSALHSGDLRDALVTFMASECGDVIAKHIDRGAYISASHAKGEQLPQEVFNQTKIDKLYRGLRGTQVPVPVSVREVLKDDSTGALQNFSQALKLSNNEVDGLQHLTCDGYLWLLVQGLRWEAGHSYNQIAAEGAGFDISQEQVDYNFLYGWKMKKDGTVLSPEQQRNFIIDLILLYIFRNEIALAPSPVNPRYTGTERTVNYAKAYQRNIGSKAKFGELYTWAKMMPYLQGVTLYLLAIAYPIVCILMIFPGWWKAMFSWMGFYAWAKSWDVGFAIVMALERSIWAGLANSENSAILNERILKLQEYGKVEIDCSNSAGGIGQGVNGTLGCPIPDVKNLGGEQTRQFALKTFDLALLMAANLDIDLANSYYIYLMSALYFAVPAVTGQVLLGAKAGASGMIQTAVGGSAQEIGKTAGAGAVGDVATRAHNAYQGVAQGSLGKALRSNSLVDRALSAGNLGAFEEYSGQVASTGASMWDRYSQEAGIRRGGQDAAASAVKATGAAGIGAYRGARSGERPSSAPPGAELPGGAGTTGRYDGTAGTAMDRFGAAMGRAGQGALGGAPDAFGAWAGYETTNAASQAQTEALGEGGRLGVEGLRHSGPARFYGLMGARSLSVAQQAAGEKQWRAMRDLSMQYTGGASAMGVFAGAYTSGPKPTQVDGMAGYGHLGAQTRDIYSGATSLGGAGGIGSDPYQMMGMTSGMDSFTSRPAWLLYRATTPSQAIAVGAAGATNGMTGTNVGAPPGTGRGRP